MCKQNKVKVNGETVKPAKEISEGDRVSAKKHGVWLVFEVLQPLQKRVGAKLVAEYARDITPEEEIEKLKVLQTKFEQGRAKGTGRPTKKDRRELEEFRNYWDDW